MFTKNHLIVYILVTVQVLLQHQSNAIKCYVCGDTNNFLYSTNNGKAESPPVSCTTLNNHWNNSTAMEKYIIECPNEYLGCITQIQGDQVSRACDVFQLDDCQRANSITYCYCSSDLCNGKTDTILVPSITDQVVHKLKSSSITTMINYKDLVDDEDYNIEMSGHGNNDNEEENIQDEIITSTVKNIIKLIETTKMQSTIKINVPQIITNTTTKNNDTGSEANLNNEILIDDEDEILTLTTEFNRKYISTSTIKNNIKIYNKNNSNTINNCFNGLLLIVVKILFDEIILICNLYY